jgi:hypothetical protein
LASPCVATRSRFGLMRYRSATVAGFHGLSRCPERVAKNGDTEALRITPGKPVRCARLGIISVDLTTPLARRALENRCINIYARKDMFACQRGVSSYVRAHGELSRFESRFFSGC